MPALLEKYRKTAGTGPGSTIGLSDWNGLIDELSSTLAGLIAKGADFDAIATVAIGVLLDRINEVLGPAYDRVTLRGAQVEALYASLTAAGIPAAVVTEGVDRLFFTAARKAAILAEIRGGVDPGLDTLGELAAALGGDPNFAATVATALGNRLRIDAAQALTTAQRSQAKTNIGAPFASVRYTEANVTLTAADMGQVIATGQPCTITLPPGATVRTGDNIKIHSLNGNGATIARQGSDVLYLQGASVAAAPVYPSQPVEVYFDGQQWEILGYVAPFRSAVNADVAQSFSAAQKAQACANIGAAYIVASGGNQQNSYEKWSDGRMRQRFSTAVNGDQTVTFPTAFPSACVNVQATVVSGYDANALTCQVGSLTAVNFSAGARKAGAAANLTVFFSAEGY